MEILAPAGSMESLLAAARCGADAVYLGGKYLNARQGAENFDKTQLAQAVSYCHVRDMRVYLTLNTLVFDEELPLVQAAIREACEAGVDAFIIQDLAVAALARECAPDIPLYASTQMSVHNLDGAKALEALGFTRVVLARELSLDEINHISKHTSLEIECFVHGALCMCISGQCYLSSMIGGRSGNRGLCAQPCRLPFSASGAVCETDTALSLKDLSVVSRISGLEEAGVGSLKIEGRLKRPEYVAAAVTACRQAIAGETPDYGALRSVFSRGGFTDGYLSGNLGPDMFGARGRDDVTAAASVLKNLALLYKDERQSVPVRLSFTMKENLPSVLVAEDGINSVRVTGDIPQKALTAPTTKEKVLASLGKTGGTPFLVSDISCELDDGLMLPASALNALRREALDNLTAMRSGQSKRFFFAPASITDFSASPLSDKKPELRVRLADISQLGDGLAEGARRLIIPAKDFPSLDSSLIKRFADKLILEIPRISFGKTDALDDVLSSARDKGICHAIAGNLGGIMRAKSHGFVIHGDYSLNAANSLAVAQYASLGLSDITASFEASLERIKSLDSRIPVGILAYGYLPLMVTRNAPLGIQRDGGALTDRLGNRFAIRNTGEAFELFNCVPLYLADRLDELSGLDFITLYFTTESAQECEWVLKSYQSAEKTDMSKTRGLYYRKVL